MKKYKIGVFGAGRGADIATNFEALGCEITALCDFNEMRRNNVKGWFKSEPTMYSNFDEFIEHDMDAVILGNFFHEHAPYAIRCMEKGIHVFSECISNGTMAEGVELIRASEKYPDVVYFLAENYPQMIFNREMQRVVKTGTLGKLLYAEGEYNHPGDPDDLGFKRTYNYFSKHWRNYCSTTYYITHSLGPVMRATGATPVTVSALPCFGPPIPARSICWTSCPMTGWSMTATGSGTPIRPAGRGLWPRPPTWSLPPPPCWPNGCPPAAPTSPCYPTGSTIPSSPARAGPTGAIFSPRSGDPSSAGRGPSPPRWTSPPSSPPPWSIPSGPFCCWAAGRAIPFCPG